MTDDIPWSHALLGGLLIGGGSFLASAVTGRIPGVSGVVARLLRPQPGDIAWRLLFLGGLVAGAAITYAAMPSKAAFTAVRPLWVMVPAGVLVGFGTRLCGGCTSGHGVCGIGLGNRDSLLATLTFMATGALTVLVAGWLS